MREELLKERIQRLRVLWKRLKAKKDESEGGPQDQEARQAEGDSSDSLLGNQQGDCNAEPCTKLGQDSPQPCCTGSDTLHHEPSGQTLPGTNGSGLKEVVDKELPQQPNPNLQESMLVRAGDVELNPGPRQGTIDSALQDMELVLLAKDVPGNYYSELSVGLGFSLIEGQNVLTKHLLDIPGALIELFGRWKLKQRDGTDCRAALGEILKETDMDALQTKLLEGN
nr:uncharacterized protein LOC129267886 [Lytechinus pictus]